MDFEWHKHNHVCSFLRLNWVNVIYFIEVYRGIEHGIPVDEPI